MSCLPPAWVSLLLKLMRCAALIERAQFALNAKIYEKGAFMQDTGFEGSWLEWFLFEIESFHGELADSERYQNSSPYIAKARRYTRSVCSSTLAGACG